MAIHTFTRRADLLQHYLDLNTGGTPHSAEEIARVRGLLNRAPDARWIIGLVSVLSAECQRLQ